MEVLNMARTRKENGEGSTRKLESGKWECIVQSRYINPRTGKPKRIKRQGKTESEARKNALQELKRWEKGIEGGKDQKVDKKKTFGQYMDDFINDEVAQGITDSAYHSYVSAPAQEICGAFLQVRASYSIFRFF